MQNSVEEHIAVAFIVFFYQNSKCNKVRLKLILYNDKRKGNSYM